MLTRIITVILLIFVATACNKGSKNGANDGKRNAGGRGGGVGRATAVKVQLVAAQSLPHKIDIVAVLKGRKQAEVYSRVSGKIASAGPAEGTQVKAGQVLIRIDRSDPGESFLTTPITSPISGWIGRWIVSSIGEHVSAQEPLVTIVDDEVLTAAVMLPTKEWLQVTKETPVQVSVSSEKREAVITRIARAAEAASGRGTVHVDVNNPDHRWKAGMVANITFDLDTKPRIVVPAPALSITDQGSFVFVVQDNVAKRLSVKFVVIDNDQVEILEGLPEGSQLITEGVSQVGDSLPVKIVEEAAKES